MKHFSFFVFPTPIILPGKPNQNLIVKNEMIKKSFVFLSQIINEQTIDSFNQSLKNLKIKKIILCSFIILPSQKIEHLFYE